MTTESETRKVEDLIGLRIPYSEMTEEEIELVIEYKTNIALRDANYEAKCKSAYDALYSELELKTKEVELECKKLDAIIAGTGEYELVDLSDDDD